MTRSRRKPSARVGRRPSTSKEELAAIGIELFMEAGFEETSIDDIAEAAGIARRTFFRYFPSKNELAWGNFDEHLAAMRASLEEIPENVPLSEALTTALHEFNTFPDSEAERHRARMRLILHTPALQAYSSVMYQGWRRVVAEFVARRTGADPDDHIPRTCGYLLLGVAIAAYEAWLDEPGSDLHEFLAAGMRTVTAGLDYSVPQPPSPPSTKAANR
ncbi:mycofactocin system transcriptional regulator [Rhodococcus sp. Z13]|uniref:Mycofactocin system transcriptional regulator n=1 Tax=Rhodococcus sacchari TaxID=2962047 RepID=A0ACD4DDJ0_9NOCA|nr:mycofactocin system transcriptional regulator [Rhodococcus sp. Z13]UYP18048.1 mycofactocin system transcriptional regulator [Rhodococcus sp. Z13]